MKTKTLYVWLHIFHLSLEFRTIYVQDFPLINVLKLIEHVVLMIDHMLSRIKVKGSTRHNKLEMETLQEESKTPSTCAGTTEVSFTSILRRQHEYIVHLHSPTYCVMRRVTACKVHFSIVMLVLYFYPRDTTRMRPRILFIENENKSESEGRS